MYLDSHVIIKHELASELHYAINQIANFWIYWSI